MLRRILFVLLLAHGSAALAEGLKITPKHGTFDPTVAFSTVHREYSIENLSSKRIAIKSWKAISGAGTVIRLPESLGPGETKTFAVDLELAQGLGEKGYRFALFTDEADVERYRFTLAGFVYSVISPERASIDFGLDAVPPGTGRELTLSARESMPLALESIEGKPEWLDARIEGSIVKVRTRATTREGIHAGSLRIRTNLAVQPIVDIPVRAILAGPLVPSTYALGFKPVEVGNSIHAQIEVRYSGSREVSDIDIQVPDGWSATRAACRSTKPQDLPCLRVELERTLTESGRTSGAVVFRVPGETELSIPFGTMALAEGQTIRELLLSDDPDRANQGKLDILKAALSSREESVSRTDSESESRSVARARGAGPVEIKWTARNESRVFGYMVYRATDRAGPFVRVTSSPIVRRDDGTTPAAYLFTDRSVESGKTYYYYIDTLARDGSLTRLSPVLSKTVVAEP